MEEFLIFFYTKVATVMYGLLDLIVKAKVSYKPLLKLVPRGCWLRSWKV